MLSVLDMLPAKRVVFRVFDLLTHFRWMPRSVYQLLTDHSERADLVVASSRPVVRQLEHLGVKALHLPNGVDLTRFDRNRAVSTPRESRAVYIGALEEWFDLQAVELWADALPAVRFDIIGPNPHRLNSRRPNIQFHEPVRPEQVPDRLYPARVGLIPFHRTPLTVGVHPLKLNEYLAAGLPVVAADLPEIAADDRRILAYRQPTEAVAMIESLMERQIDRGELYELAAEHSWSRLLDVVLDRIGLLGVNDRPGAEGPRSQSGTT